jgi:hypothetical protein
VQTAIAVKLSDLREIDISLPAKSGNLEELLFPNSQINNLNNVHADLTPVKANWKIFLCVLFKCRSFIEPKKAFGVPLIRNLLISLQRSYTLARGLASKQGGFVGRHSIHFCTVNHPIKRFDQCKEGFKVAGFPFTQGEEFLAGDIKDWICSEALIIFGIHEYNRRIHQNPYLFMKFKDFIDILGVS